MSSNNFPRCFLKQKEEKEILQGFPWAFDNEILYFKHRPNEKSEWKKEDFEKCTIPNGSAVELYTNAGGFLGTGILNRNSKISVRLISNDHADVVFSDIENFWFQKVEDAFFIRKVNFSKKDSYRLIFGEADLIPGLICDLFCDVEGKIYLVVQFLSMSCDVFRTEILNALLKIVKPDFIFERSDNSVREKEGLPLVAGWLNLEDSDFSIASEDDEKYFGKDNIIIEENGLKLLLDITNGQKTGYFLDQKFNRSEIKKYCKGKKVLDTFTHTGAFGLNAFAAGAKEVISVDISEDAVEIVKENIKLNNATKTNRAVCADVFDLLKKYESMNEKFDVIILDPPAFTKSAKMIEKAYGGYKEINLRAMRLLNKGGILITCSCSYFMETNMFCDMIMHSAMDSHKKVQILEKRGAGPDHPVLVGYPKSEYLKCVVCRVL